MKIKCFDGKIILTDNICYDGDGLFMLEGCIVIMGKSHRYYDKYFVKNVEIMETVTSVGGSNKK